MRVIYTDAALVDLEAILDHQTEHWPQARAPFEERLAAIEQALARFPHEAPEVTERPGVRTIAFVQFPYRLFYEATANGIEILSIQHTARHPWYA